MENVHGIGEQPDLLKVVHGVRARWRLKHALRGAAITVAGSFIVYALSSWAVHSTNYSQGSIIAARVVCIAALIALAGRFIFWPLRPKVRDEQVALYLEEHEPTLDGALFTAVEVDMAARAGVAPRSVGLSKRLAESAAERARAI